MMSWTQKVVSSSVGAVVRAPAYMAWRECGYITRSWLSMRTRLNIRLYNYVQTHLAFTMLYIIHTVFFHFFLSVWLVGFHVFCSQHFNFWKTFSISLLQTLEFFANGNNGRRKPIIQLKQKQYIKKNIYTSFLRIAAFFKVAARQI